MYLHIITLLTQAVLTKRNDVAFNQEESPPGYLNRLDCYETWLEYTSKEMQTCKDRLRMLLDLLTARQPTPEATREISKDQEGKKSVLDYSLIFEEKYEKLKDHIELSRGVLTGTKAMIKSYV